jgi:HEAT repeat protein
MVAGSEDTLAEIAKTEPDPTLRRKAIQMVGVNGGDKVGSTLVSIYNSTNDPSTKRQAIEGLFVSDNAASLIDLYRKETDPQLKRELIEKISLMDDKEARDLMIQILEKE